MTFLMAPIGDDSDGRDDHHGGHGPELPGRLFLAPGWSRRLGVDGPDVHWTCMTCHVSYPEINGQIRCNGHVIDLCPTCRVDSAPWKNGRGC